MSTKIPTVSVLMPVYNRQELVADAIRSIQGQTFEDWELIILDDASTDQTQEVCRTFAAEDRRITVHSNPTNLGVGESRNRLLCLAKGELLAIQDSDDVSVPERLSLEVEILNAHLDVGLVGGVAAFVDDNGDVFRYYPEHLHNGIPYPKDRREMVRGLFVAECNIANPTCMFRRALLEKMTKPFGDFRLAEDRYFFLQIASLTRIWGIPQVLVRMSRGQSHEHVWKDTLAGIREARRGLDSICRKYRNQDDSLITSAIHRRALADSLVREARYFGGLHGLPQLLRALTYDPLNRFAWSSLQEFSIRGLRKLTSGKLLRN